MHLLLILLLVIIADADEENVIIVMKDKMERCVERLNLNQDEMWIIWQQPTIPVDNPNFTLLVECFFKDLHVFDNNVFNKERFQILLPFMIQHKTSATLDKSKQAAKEIPDSCYELPIKESLVIHVIQIRNCIYKSVIDSISNR
ncbi:hypothetical protein FQR65_LT07865 [Abscondita terminalis]|nr:hypothetical protein FQR65_LT07865 [Abscondita terminalis]